MTSPLLAGIGSQILGSMFSANAAKRERSQNVDDVRQQFVRLREGAELAGFNPLSVLGTASGIPSPGTSGASYMGQAIADSGLMLADSLAKTQGAATLMRADALQTENSSLLQRLTRATLRPKVGGVYEQRDSVPACSTRWRASIPRDRGQPFPAIAGSRSTG